MRMKVKFFYHSYIDNKENFEQRVNDFMATVEVVDVRHSEVCLSDGKRFKAFTNVMVLYK